MTESMREHAIRAVRNQLGTATDNLHRAEHSFKGMSPEELANPYGQSGYTCQQILDGYRKSKDEAESTIAWLEGLP